MLLQECASRQRATTFQLTPAVEHVSVERSPGGTALATIATHCVGGVEAEKHRGKAFVHACERASIEVEKQTLKHKHGSPQIFRLTCAKHAMTASAAWPPGSYSSEKFH